MDGLLWMVYIGWRGEVSTTLIYRRPCIYIYRSLHHDQCHHASVLAAQLWTPSHPSSKYPHPRFCTRAPPGRGIHICFCRLGILLYGQVQKDVSKNVRFNFPGKFRSPFPCKMSLTMPCTLHNRVSEKS